MYLSLLFSLFLAINRIEQKGGWTVVASACTGGLPDTVDGEYPSHIILLH